MGGAQKRNREPKYGPETRMNTISAEVEWLKVPQEYHKLLLIYSSLFIKAELKRRCCYYSVRSKPMSSAPATFHRHSLPSL